MNALRLIDGSHDEPSDDALMLLARTGDTRAFSTLVILSLKFLREPTERLWDIYQANGSLTEQQIRAVEKKPIKEVWVAPNGLGLAGGFKF